jgi:hypothetical protein
MMNVSIGAAWLDDRIESEFRATVPFDLVSCIGHDVLVVAFI